MFIALLGLAMSLYPGGTWWDAKRIGHSFWENFLCDLLHRQALGGQSNVRSANITVWAMLVLVLGLVTAFSLAPEVVPSRRRLGKTLAWSGGFGALLLVSAPLFPSDLHPRIHSAAVVFGGLPALVSFAAFVGAILIEPATTRLLRAVSLALLVLLALALALYTWTAFLNGPSLRILPGIERVANLTLLLWLALLSRLVRRRLIATYIVLAKRAAEARTKD